VNINNKQRHSICQYLLQCWALVSWRHLHNEETRSLHETQFIACFIHMTSVSGNKELRKIFGSKQD
jgi:hypothetical protein